MTKDRPMTVEDIQCWISSEMIEAKNDYERYWKELVNNDFDRHSPLEIKYGNQTMAYLANYEYTYKTLESIQRSLGWSKTKYRKQYDEPTVNETLDRFGCHVNIDECRNNVEMWFVDLVNDRYKRNNTINALNVDVKGNGKI
jgi:hypothetical protein